MSSVEYTVEWSSLLKWNKYLQLFQVHSLPNQAKDKKMNKAYNEKVKQPKAERVLQRVSRPAIKQSSKTPRIKWHSLCLFRVRCKNMKRILKLAHKGWTFTKQFASIRSKLNFSFSNVCYGMLFASLTYLLIFPFLCHQTSLHEMAIVTLRLLSIQNLLTIKGGTPLSLSLDNNY